MAILDQRGRPLREEHRSSGGTHGHRGGYYGGLTSGGIVNYGSGMGTGVDKSVGGFFQPTRYLYREALEILGVQSWAAANFISIPVIDAFLKWRSFVDEEASKKDKPSGRGGIIPIDEMADQEGKWNLTERLAQLMIAARQYGTGALIPMTMEAPMDQPLVPERIRKDDLKALRVLDRYDLSGVEWDMDHFSPNYGKPLYYMVHPNRGGSPMRVHHTRVFRTEGLRSAGDSGFRAYDLDWGVSNLVPVILALLEDQTLASAIAHLSTEASIPVLTVANLRELQAGRGGQHELSPDQIGAEFNRTKSNWKLAMLDKGSEEFMRVAVQFAGLADLMDRYSGRVAAAGQIPVTRFLSRAPQGMNATGEGDNRNYIMLVEGNRSSRLDPHLPTLDEIIARNAGFAAAPGYEWHSLLELGEAEEADAAVKRVDAVVKAIGVGLCDEDEGRDAVRGSRLFDHLEGNAPELPPMPLAMPGAPGAGPGGKPAAGNGNGGPKPSPAASQGR